MKRYELTDEQWSRISPLLPSERGRWGRPANENRTMLTGMIWILRSGAPWRDLPERYGPWNSVYTRFNRWSKKNVLKRVFEALSEDLDTESFMIDSTVVRAHQHSTGARKSEKNNP